MKKITFLAIAAALCLLSCDDSKSSGGNDQFDYSKPATESQAADIVKNVQDNAAKNNARPGSKEYCEVISEALKNAEHIYFSGDYSEKLQIQIATLEQHIKSCLSDTEKGSSLDWYKEKQKEAATAAADDDSLFNKLVEMTKEGIAAGMAFDGNCENIKAEYDKIYEKYAPYLDAFVAMTDESSVPQDKWKSLIARLYDATDQSEESQKAHSEKEREIHEKCGDLSFNSDPCSNKICNFANGSVCVNGECVDTCSKVECASDLVCSYGTCVKKTCLEDPTICGSDQICSSGTCIPKPTTTSCTLDPSLCNEDQECQKGTCVPKAPLSPCDQYSRTKTTYKLMFKHMSTCAMLLADEDILMNNAAVDGIDMHKSETYDDFLDACFAEWDEQLVDELGVEKMVEILKIARSIDFDTCISYLYISNQVFDPCKPCEKADSDSKEACLTLCKTPLEEINYCDTCDDLPKRARECKEMCEKHITCDKCSSFIDSTTREVCALVCENEDEEDYWL